MGTVYAEITLKNTKDVLFANSGAIKDQDVRQTKVRAMVDTGAGTLIITEAIQQKLGLELLEERPVRLADRTIRVCRYAEPVEIYWKDRYSTIRPMVLAGSEEVLLGAIPLQDMDLIVDPARHELIGAHGDKIVHRV